MITVKSREHFDREILINEAKILYVVPSERGGVIVYFDKSSFLVLNESFEEFQKKFEQKIPTSIELGQKSIEQFIKKTETIDYKDLDQYPEYLPRLPSGFVDKRTTAYKEYVASLENAK